MECIPAIDLKNGKCVRLTQGKFDQQNLYSDDPVTIAKRWVSEGAARLHIIDLDGARLGAPSTQHLRIVREIIRRFKVPVQLGGGIRSREIVERVLGIGVDRAIIGTAAVSDPLIGESFQEFGDHLVLGIDARDGMTAISGWVETTQIPALDFAREMVQLGVRRIIFTDIARDGMLQGVNVDAVREMMQASGVPVIAAGGVTTIEDIAQLSAIGADGAILGKALYENALRLPDALASASGTLTSAPPAQHRQNAQQPAPQPAAPGPPASSAPATPYLPWMKKQ